MRPVARRLPSAAIPGEILFNGDRGITFRDVVAADRPGSPREAGPGAVIIDIAAHTKHTRGNRRPQPALPASTCRVGFDLPG